jgi:hypothetical protein
VPPAASKQISATAEPGTLSFDASNADDTAFPPLGVETEEDELVERDICERFKKMCEGYFESVSKKLVIEHKVGAIGTLCQDTVTWRLHRDYKSKIVVTMKHISARARSSKIVNKRMRR